MKQRYRLNCPSELETTVGRNFNSVCGGDFCFAVNLITLIVPEQGDNDDTAMNGIRFECTHSSEQVEFYGYWGEWDDWKYCSGGFSGADIKVDLDTVSINPSFRQVVS